MVDRNRWSVYILTLVERYHKLGPCSVVRFWISPLYSTNCVFSGSTRWELIKKKKTISTYVLQLKRRFTIREYFFKKLNEYCRIDFTWTLHMIYKHTWLCMMSAVVTRLNAEDVNICVNVTMNRDVCKRIHRRKDKLTWRNIYHQRRL